MYKGKNKILFIALFLLSVVTFFALPNNKILAIENQCQNAVEGTIFYDCGNRIYTYSPDITNSSYIQTLNKDVSFLYSGKVDDSFVVYVNYFKFYNISYDDRSFSNNNLWGEISRNNRILFSGKLKDSIILDDSHQGVVGSYYDSIYFVYQYHKNGKIYKKITIRNVEDTNIEVLNLKYNGNIFTDDLNKIEQANEDIVITLQSDYGIKYADVILNDNSIKSKIMGNKIIIDKDEFNKNLVNGKVAKLKIKVNDYLNFSKTIDYKLVSANQNVSISFSSLSSSISEGNSRRIVISAVAGSGKQLDKDYCWYYWSTSPDHSLTYEDFLRNYANSEYKGSYSEDKGVILRNTQGVYYVYALAKDNDSWVVEKSEGYELNNPRNLASYRINDAIFLVCMLIVALLPIVIYIWITKKEY